MPLIINSYQKQVTVEKLKKTYSALAQTTARAISDNGPITSWEVNNITAADFMKTYLMPYMSVGKSCLNSSSSKECNYKSKFLNGLDVGYTQNSNSFYLNDGTRIIVYNINIGPTRIFVEIWADINGEKGPNIVGKDLFGFRYEIYNIDVPQMQGSFFPIDYILTRERALNENFSGCNKQARGIYCSNVIMKDGWQIKDDYPW